jgi:hypothetical protein
MSDYIDDFKKKQDAKGIREHRREEIRLHDMEVIKAQASLFWQSAVQQIRVDCEKVKATFPNETRYEYQLEVEGNGFTLRHGGFPTTIIRAEMQLAGSVIQVWKGSQNGPLAPEPLGNREEIRIKVDKDENLQFITSQQKDISSVSEFARHFVSETWGIS